jgi:hypothetical protein
MKIGLGIGLGYSKESGSSVPAAPANVVLPSLIGSGAVGTVVTCNRGSWSGSPSPTYTFNFLVDSISVQNTASNTYTPLSGDDTKTLTCVVTATNPLGTASATTSNSLVVGTIPVNTAAPDITPFDNQVIGTSLSATTGTWDGTPTLTFAYRWTRNNVPISGATSTTYTLQAADELQTIRVEVRATNDYATSSFVVSSNNAVGGYAPSNVSQPSMSLLGNQLVGTLVTVTNGTWSGSSPITFEYRWLRNGSPIGGATSSSYTLQSADDGNAVTAQVRALNAFGTSAYSTSDNSINAGTVPVNTVAPTVSPSGTQSTGTLITADVESWDGTAPITFEYKWTRDGIAISGATASTYTIQLADDGTTIRVEVKGTNAYGASGFVASSNSVSAVNTVAPTISSATISGTAVVGQTLTASASGVTGIPTPTLSYQWKRGATNIGTNADTYTLVQADAGNTSNITCVVTATNAGGSANATSNTIAQIFDATANTFITNALITNSTQRSAVNFEMVTLKAGGVTSGYIASYPLVGGTATTHKWNMFNSLDTDAAKRLTFAGTITHDANGMQGNGTNGTANSFINPSLDLTNDFTAWVYSRTTTTATSTRADFGILGTAPFPGTYLSVNSHTNTGNAANFTNDSAAAQPNTSGLFLLKRVGTTITLKRNNVVIRTYTASSLTLLNGQIRLMSGLVLPSAIVNYSNKQYTDFGFLNVGTNDTQDTAIFNAVVGKETILGRNV